MEKLILIVVEAALELAPRETWGHPAVRSYASRRGKRPGEVLLDRSYHHAAMKGLTEAHKRGRPDIIHLALLEALGSPLNRRGLLETYVQARSGHVIWVNPGTRLPRNYDRFKGLVEKLYKEPVVEAGGETLLRMEEKGLRELLQELSPDLRILLSEKGEYMRPTELAELILRQRRPAAMVGGFPHGDFSEETLSQAQLTVSIHPQPLDTWTTISRLLCPIENKLEENLK